MKTYSRTEAIARMNELAGANVPFLFIVDYAQEQSHIEPLDRIDPATCLFQFRKAGNTAASAMTGALFQVSPLNTFVLCVVMRVLMGWCCGLIFSALKKLDKSRTWSYIVSAMSAPFLNTLFFMGYIVLAFYNCDYVQNLVSVKGAANPLMFVVLLVGVQGVAEFLVSGILGGIVARAVHKFLK